MIKKTEMGDEREKRADAGPATPDWSQLGCAGLDGLFEDDQEAAGLTERRLRRLEEALQLPPLA